MIKYNNKMISIWQSWIDKSKHQILLELLQRAIDNSLATSQSSIDTQTSKFGSKIKTSSPQKFKSIVDNKEERRKKWIEGFPTI